MNYAYKNNRKRDNRRSHYKNMRERIINASSHYPRALVKVSISNNRGAVVIWGKPEHKGKAVALLGHPSDNRTRRLRYDAEFVPYQYSSLGPVYAAVFNRVVPGNFYTEHHICGQAHNRLSIAPGIVTQLDWT